MALPDPKEALRFYRDILDRDHYAPALLRLGFGRRSTTVPLNHTGHPSDDLMIAARATATGLLPQPDWALFCSDSYTVKPGAAVDADSRRGDLAARFDRGDPDVTECIMAMAANREGELSHIVQRYRRLKSLNGVCSYEDPEVHIHGQDDAKLDGYVVDGLSLLLGIKLGE